MRAGSHAVSEADQQKHQLSYATGRLRAEQRQKPPFVTGWDLVVIGVLAFLAAMLGWVGYTRLTWEPM